MTMSADWDEIKRLAADFQRAQLTTSLQRLSESNCIEIISKLVEQKIIEIYFTSNGKEYITPNQLIKEIKDEVFLHGGRISLTELSTILDVSINVVEKKANELCRNFPIHRVLGELISDAYISSLCEEINEKLQQSGLITVADLARQHNLPGDFLHTLVVRRLGKIIHGQQDESDPQTFFNDEFVARHKSQIRGVLTAITHPTALSTIIPKFNFQENLFFSITDMLIQSGEVRGTITGLRLASQAVFVPDVYAKAQHDWVTNFLRQNGYLEFDSLRRLGIHDPESYIKRNVKDEKLTFVRGACVGKMLIEQVEANIDDALARGSYIDIFPYLPSTFSGSVCSDLINLALEAHESSVKAARCSKASSECDLFCDSIVVSGKLLTKISVSLEELMPVKAKEAVLKGAFKHQVSGGKVRMEEDLSSKNKKEDRRKKATGGKSGGGTQGRETKTKSTKKHKRGKASHNMSDDEDDESSHKGPKANEIEFLPMEDLQTVIGRDPELEDCPEELLEALAEHFYEGMTKKFQEVAKTVFLANMSAQGDSRRNTHQQVQEKVLSLHATVRLAEKGMKEFGVDIEMQLCKYALKTHCSDIVNELAQYLAEEQRIEVNHNKEVSQELRLKIINQLDNDVKAPLLAVHKTLTGGSIDEFIEKVDDALAVADILIRKKDNKKDKQVLLNHRSGLIDQLTVSMTAALSLHLACLVLFQSVTGNLLHASGKFVPNIISFLKPHLPLPVFGILQEYQGLVIRSLKEDKGGDSALNTRIEELTPMVKEVAVSFRKSKDRENSVSED